MLFHKLYDQAKRGPVASRLIKNSPVYCLDFCKVLRNISEAFFCESAKAVANESVVRSMNSNIFDLVNLLSFYTTYYYYCLFAIQ